ncbi:sensor histidine kinase [Novosphingobium sp. 9]|uniref:sensor histidine kinase n=1 Tax=Novosphingobium sp. 9 TaxID=2025349 RepID=UPI0021B6A47B|nr:sensor histidine kinase [Novosphingobium sp. 9]
MHFDDRLATVLRLPATGDSLARIQYRQLVDILSRMPDSVRGTDSGSLLDSAFDALDSLKKRIPAAECARLIAQSGHPISNPRLVEQLALGAPPIALAAIARAQLSESTWLALVPKLPVGARGIVRHRSDLPANVLALLDRLGVQDRTLPQAEAVRTETYIPKTPEIEAPPLASAPQFIPKQASSEQAISTLSEPATPLPPLELELAAIFGEDFDAPGSMSPLADGIAHAPVTVIATTPVTAALPDGAFPDTTPPLPANVHALRPARSGKDHSDSEIGAIVRRIEAYRKARESRLDVQSGKDDTREATDASPPPSRLPAAIDFETDSLGRVTWAEGPCAPCIVGMQLPLTATTDALHIAFAERRPLVGHVVQLDGSALICGYWNIDAMPDFSSGGAFRGYFGRLRRRVAARAGGLSQPESHTPAEADKPGDRLREVLHELRTPANAIQVAAEIIQQQLYGPAPHEYRALAAAVAGDCAHILAGFEELERLVKLETGAMRLDPGECEFTSVLASVAERLRAWTQPRRSGFSLLSAPDDIRVSLTGADAEMLAWRLLAALAGSTAPDEVLELGWVRDSTPGASRDTIAIRSALPARLSARDQDDLFAAIPGDRGHSLAVGAFGTGFTLRLAAAEARAAGGGLRREGNDLVLWLPALTAASAHHSTLDAACFGS